MNIFSSVYSSALVFTIFVIGEETIRKLWKKPISHRDFKIKIFMTAGVGFISGPAAPVVLPIWGLWTAGPALVATKVGGLVGGVWLGTITAPV